MWKHWDGLMEKYWGWPMGKNWDELRGKYWDGSMGKGCVKG
jgi:hypothetical protein